MREEVTDAVMSRRWEEDPPRCLPAAGRFGMTGIMARQDAMGEVLPAKARLRMTKVEKRS